MDMFVDYIQERQGKSAIVIDGVGFATYYFTEENDCYIEDIFVVDGHRKTGAASEMADTISELARERSCKMLLGSVVPSVNGSTTSLKVLLGYGFKLMRSQDNFILFGKEL